MANFYRQCIVWGLGFLIQAVLAGLFCYRFTFFSLSLQPAADSAYPWALEFERNYEVSGADTFVVLKNDELLSVRVPQPDSVVAYPYAAAILAFDKLEDANNYADLQRFLSFSFDVQCDVATQLVLVLHSYDDQHTQLGAFKSYRRSEARFNCSEQWLKVHFDIQRLEVSDWWLKQYGAKMSDHNYDLGKTLAISIANSDIMLNKIPGEINVREMIFNGRSYLSLWLFAAIEVLLAAALISVFVKRYIRALVADVKHKLERDNTLISFKQLSLGPDKDQEKSRILRYMATEYANPGLQLETAVQHLGISHTKLNRLLKAEHGLTFSAYLNKLRLTEAARLLRQSGDLSVTQIAYSVGYKNVSHFNQLFKKEYACTPTTFRKLGSS